MNPSQAGPQDYHEERAQAKGVAAEFEAMLRYLPVPTKADRRLASYGCDHEGLGRLSRVTLKPGEALEVRVVPFSPYPERHFLRLFQHFWPPFDSPVKLRTICAHQSDFTLVNKAADKCEACSAGVATEFHAIAYALVDDHRRAVGIKFTPQNLKSLQSLIGDGVFEFKTGRRVRLAADDRWHLSYELLEHEPISERDFRRAIDFGQPHLIPLDARLDKLHDITTALGGWLKAGKPEPKPGQSLRLIKLLPHCTLVPIPWGCKGPQEPGWQNVGFPMMEDANYLGKLDGGNIGLLCGRDQDAVNKGLVANLIIIGLDADTDDFADRVCQYNPWLNETFAVEGGRGLKWFLAVAGPGMEACLQSTKIMQRRADKDVEVGDWLSTGKQGVVWGLHPSGKMYTPNWKPLVVIPLKRFRLPKGCYLVLLCYVYIDFIVLRR
jgi:hypothetical protein